VFSADPTQAADARLQSPSIAGLPGGVETLSLLRIRTRTSVVESDQ
jgi:hypothetical protein